MSKPSEKPAEKPPAPKKSEPGMKTLTAPGNKAATPSSKTLKPGDYREIAKTAKTPDEVLAAIKGRKWDL